MGTVETILCLAPLWGILAIWARNNDEKRHG
jgi:hypothetical protein